MELAEDLKKKGNQCFKEKRYNKAIYYYSKALDEHVTSVILSNRAQAYLNLHRAEEAYSDSYEAVLRDPNNQKALYRQAFALNKLGLKAKARKKLERCIELDPKNVEARQLFSSIPADAKDQNIVNVLPLQKAELLQSSKPLRKRTIQIMSDGQSNTRSKSGHKSGDASKSSISMPKPLVSFPNFAQNVANLHMENQR